jgi:hypothetical protein
MKRTGYLTVTLVLLSTALFAAQQSGNENGGVVAGKVLLAVREGQ